MNNFFENHLEEIKIITARSKKEARKSFSRLQKASEYILKIRNENVLENEVKTIEGINVHQLTKDGKVLIGSSDRIYLPDVATRLYQGLDNILKSYKSHKVHNEDIVINSAEDNSNRIEYIDLAEWENEYLKETLVNLYESLSENAKKIFDIEFLLEGLFSIWNIYSPESKNSEFDEFYLILNYKICDKTNDILLANKYKRITNSDLRNKRVNLESIKIFIEELAELISKEKTVLEKISPDLVLFSNELTSQLLLFLLSKKEQFLTEHKNLQEFSHSHLINENFDHFGRELNENNKVDESGFMPRQAKFHSKIHLMPRNLSLGDFSIQDDNLEQTIKEMLLDAAKIYNKKKFVYIFSTNSINNTDFDQSFVINPTIALYFDGKESRLVDMNLVEINDFSHLEFSDQKHLNLQKHSDLYVGLNSPAHSFISKQKVTLA